MISSGNKTTIIRLIFKGGHYRYRIISWSGRLPGVCLGWLCARQSDPGMLFFLRLLWNFNNANEKCS